MRWNLGVVGVFLLVMWFACWCVTVVPGSPAVTTQWAAGNILAFLAGISFGAAACWKHRATPSPPDPSR